MPNYVDYLWYWYVNLNLPGWVPLAFVFGCSAIAGWLAASARVKL